jgi:hypothetical protein
MARRKPEQIALPLGPVAACDPGLPVAPVPDWRPAEPIAEDHYAGPPLPEPEPQGRTRPVREDAPVCPSCGARGGLALEHPGIPNDLHLSCAYCCALWTGTAADVAQAKRAERALESYTKAQETRRARIERTVMERQRARRLRDEAGLKSPECLACGNPEERKVLALGGNPDRVPLCWPCEKHLRTLRRIRPGDALVWEHVEAFAQKQRARIEKELKQRLEKRNG